MPGDTNFPPQFAESSISGAIGSINDFAGSENMDSRSFAAPNAAVQKALGSLGKLTDGIPVVITGSRPPTNANFPGLRETMIGSAIFQLAEQIPGDNQYKQEILELALRLHESGAEKILRNRDSNGPKKGRSKK